MKAKDPENAVTAIGLVVVGNILTRVIGLGSQIALGWFLLPEDFGIYALALSFAAAVSALRSGGAAQIMIKNGATLCGEAAKFFAYAFVFNLLACLILMVIAIPYLHSGSAVGVILIGTAISIPLGTHASIYRAKLTIDRQFSFLSKMSCLSALLWQGSIVLCASLGWGAASFALAPVLQSLYEGFALRGRSNISIEMTLHRVPVRELGMLFHQARWVMLGSALLALATTGDYFAVSMLADAKTVGIYYFAFQLNVALINPLSGAIENAVPALLTNIHGDAQRQNAAYSRALSWAAAITIPLGLLCAITAPALINTLWNGKWDFAIPVVQIISFCASSWTLASAARALIEAHGLWQLRFTVMAVYGIGAISAAAIGAYMGDAISIAFAVSIFYVCFTCGLLVTLNRMGVSNVSMWKTLFLPLVINLVAAYMAVIIVTTAFSADHLVVRSGATALLYLLLGAAANFLFMNQIWRDIAGAAYSRLFVRRVRRPTSAVLP
jgi:O-antigen/teichoic acid export membrane protein